MVKYHSDSESGNPLPLLFLINSKSSFICTIPQTGYHIPQPLLQQLWSTGWNESIMIETNKVKKRTIFNKTRQYNI